MSVLKFEKDLLGNLEYSLQREMLSTDRSGGYMSTTIVCCNTRKYHGLMVCPIEEFKDDKNYVMLSSLDETVIQHDQSFNLAIHRYPGLYEPRGHKYITDFNYTPTPTITYKVGGVLLRKEMLWIHSRTQLMIRYTLLEARSQTWLRLRPFLAFRDSHTVARANIFADGRTYPIPSGVKARLYEHFPWLSMQTSRPAEFVPAPDWYYSFEYPEEAKRGYPYQEDLITPGFFETELKKGESIIFSCSFEEADPSAIEGLFEAELAKRSNKIDFLSCLRHSARQFVARRGGRAEVIAGFPWFGRWGRDTFIALPGITLSQGRVEECMDVVDTLTGEMKDGLFPNMGTAYNSVDAPLWFFWTLQQLEKHIGSEKIWEKYSAHMKEVLEAYVRGIGDHVKVGETNLVWASHPTHAMTWMDAVVDGKPVTGRDGYQVEINALWYNAICYTLRLAGEFGDKTFTEKWKDMPEKIRSSFIQMFWNRENGYLADYVDESGQNLFIRPNQVIALSTEFTMLDEQQALSVIKTIRQHLLTPKGLRTLSPRNPLYQGRYGGDQATRDRQYHQGTVWPWLLEHYAAANFKLYGKAFLDEAKELLKGFEEDIQSYGIGSIPEIYDGDPPHAQRGAPSQAWSVGAVLRINEMIENYGGGQ
ncbi:MAG: amylo-alpha-1,6-glucosidase [Rikenellaceae bacterium]|nr:amylo-alpha-1,6-glucosidase [Rikenellaceae bacterium]